MHKLTLITYFDYVTVKETLHKNDPKIRRCIPTGNSYSPPSVFFFNKILYQYLQLEYEGNNAQNQHFWSFFSNKVIEKKFCKVLFDNHIPHLLKKKKKKNNKKTYIHL